MKKYKCPDCGKEFGDGIIPVECPTCGCSADSIIKNEICPQCGKALPLQNMRFCPECGCNLSAQPTKDYDVICPDCNAVIADEHSDCPICSCPSNMFIKRAKTKFVADERLECPDCGKVFDDIIPAECPNCGCPSNEFKELITEKELHKPTVYKKSSHLAILIICFLGAIPLVGYIYNNIQEAKEKERQEQYQKEQQAQREREEREQEEQRIQIEKADKELFQKMAGTYVSEYFYYKGAYLKWRIILYRSGKYEIELLNDYHRVVDRRTGDWEACSSANAIALDIDKVSREWGGAIGIVGNHLMFGDVECY